jgi:hypothetical protein
MLETTLSEGKGIMTVEQKEEYVKGALSRKVPTHGIKLNLVLAEITNTDPMQIEDKYLAAHRMIQKVFAEG